jgi:threonine dehydrogenase-like Zn-dependent dehydrogenase
MLAAVLEGDRRVAMWEVPEPEPGPDEVRVRMLGAGVCASELPVWEGREWFSYPQAPGEPGHEGWGEVEALGGGVSGLSRGEKVAFIGSGAHAEFAVVPAAACVVLPGDPFPGEPVACAMNAFGRSGVRGGERVAIVGAGFIGLLLTQLCRGVAAEIEVLSRRRCALEAAERFGATRLHHGYADAPGEESFDIVFEVTGHQGPLDLAARLCRIRGRLVIVGYHQDGPRTVDMQMWNWRGLDVINAHERDESIYVAGLRDAVQAVSSGRVEPQPLLTDAFTLGELGEAYRISTERPEGFVKAVWRAG